MDREPFQGQPLRAQARLGGQEGTAPAVQLRQPPHQLPDPGEGKLGQRRLVHEETPQQAAVLIGQPESAVGGVCLPPDGGEGGFHGIEILLVAADAGDGHALIEFALIPACLKGLVGVRVDPVELHLLQSPALLDLPAESGELIVPGHQLQAPAHRLQGAVPVSEVGTELAGLQPAPGILRVQGHAGLRIMPGLLQAAAVHQGAGVAIVPDPAPGRLRRRFRGGHPLGSFIIVVIVVDVVAGIGVPQGKIQIAPGLLLRELSLTHTVPDPLV